MNQLTEPQPFLASLLLGQIMPYLIAIINRKVPSEKGRYWVSLVLCVLVGVLSSIALFDFSNPLAALASGGLVFTSAQTAYRTYFKESQYNVKMMSPTL